MQFVAAATNLTLFVGAKMTDNRLPLSIRDTKPFQHATRLTGYRHDGLPDGFHTGGAWLWENKVYKPLDGRPYANCDHHYPTQEAEFLAEVSDLASFPKNWTVETHNGRRWLVRDRVIVLGGKDAPYKGCLDKTDLLQIGADIREINRRGWELQDCLSLGYDNNGWFILDCSTVHRMTGNGCYAADDTHYVEKLFEICGYDWLAKLRQAGRHATNEYQMKAVKENRIEDIKLHLYHAYASFSRPFDFMWADKPGCNVGLLHNDFVDWNKQQPHTWILASEPLPKEYLERYELTWAWSPIK